MTDIVDALERDGYGWIAHPAGFAPVLAAAYCAWQSLLECGDRSLGQGDGAVPEGYVPLRLDLRGELKHSYYCRTNTAVPPSAREITATVIDALSTLSVRVGDEVRHRFGPSAVRSPNRGCLRIMLYPALRGPRAPSGLAELAAGGCVRAIAHTDLNALTLLPAATAPGLEVFERSGWTALDDRPGHVLVQVGQELEARTGARLQATRHRVRNPRPDEAAIPRMALAFFVS